MIAVLDSSVLLNTIATEKAERDASQRLITSLLEDDITLAAPHLLTFEVGNGLCKYLYRELIPDSVVAEVSDWFEALPLALYPAPAPKDMTKTGQLLGRVTAYDAAYLHLAQRLDAPFWTFDKKLRNNATAKGFVVRDPADLDR